jgi:hypothetical protein
MFVVQNRLIDLLAAKMVQERRTITVAEVARACGMKRQNAHKWLNNQIKCYPAETMAMFCQIFLSSPIRTCIDG